VRSLALLVLAGCVDPPDAVPIVLDEPYLVGDEVTFYVDDFCIPGIIEHDCWDRWFVTGVDGIVVQALDVDPIAAMAGQGRLDVQAHWRGWGSGDVTSSVTVTVVEP
jgi:hypothetical protein